MPLVESALCPLDPKVSKKNGSIHRSHFNYYDKNGKRKQATIETTAAFGLSPNDDFYLWGLLAGAGLASMNLSKPRLVNFWNRDLVKPKRDKKRKPMLAAELKSSKNVSKGAATRFEHLEYCILPTQFIRQISVFVDRSL